MKKKKGRSVIGSSETPLPEAIIQKIQSFMSGKEAARTTILSKSWRNAWLTRPSIDLDDCDIAPVAFQEFSSKTMQRYRDLSLNIESFRLRRHSHDCKADTRSLIVDAMKIGATHVQLEIPFSSTLPQEVLGSQTLVKLSLSDCKVDGDYVIKCLGLEELSLIRCTGFALKNLYELQLNKLTRLSLHSVDVGCMLSTDFATRFPCLKDLSIRSCPGSTRIKISTTSLQTISFKPIKGSWRAKFDVPNIRKFSLSVSGLPSHLSVNAASREWKFHISIACNQFHKSSWFLKLKEYLRKFRLSIITLSVHLTCGRLPDLDESSPQHEIYTQIEGEPLVLKQLMIDAPSSFCSALLIRLFGVFRPKHMHHYWFSDKCHGWFFKNEALDVLCTRLMKKPITPDCGIPNQHMFGQFNLKKVKVEVYENLDTEWQPLVLKEPLDASKAPVNKCTVWFELIWGD